MRLVKLLMMLGLQQLGRLILCIGLPVLPLVQMVVIISCYDDHYHRDPLVRGTPLILRVWYP